MRSTKLMKMEIYNGNFDNYTTATVFQFNYFNGSSFSKKVAYCSSIDVPREKIVSFKISTLAMKKMF